MCREEANMYQFRDFLETCMYTLTVYSQHLGKPLTRTKLAKLLYIADLRAVDQGVPVRTGAVWTWEHFGPFDDALMHREDQLVALGVFQREYNRTFYGTEYAKLSVSPDQYRDVMEDASDVDRKFFEIMREVALQFADASPSEVREYSYQTAPMALAQSDDGERGCVLDMSLGEYGHRRVVQRSSALTRIQELRARNNGKYTHFVEGDPTEILQETSHFDRARRQANRLLLGSEGRGTA